VEQPVSAFPFGLGLGDGDEVDDRDSAVILPIDHDPIVGRIHGQPPCLLTLGPVVVNHQLPQNASITITNEHRMPKHPRIDPGFTFASPL